MRALCKLGSDSELLKKATGEIAQYVDENAGSAAADKSTVITALKTSRDFLEGLSSNEEESMRTVLAPVLETDNASDLILTQDERNSRERKYFNSSLKALLNMSESLGSLRGAFEKAKAWPDGCTASNKLRGCLKKLATRTFTEMKKIFTAMPNFESKLPRDTELNLNIVPSA